MKNITRFLVICGLIAGFLFVNITSVKAWDTEGTADCQPGFKYSPTTGERCPSTPVSGCQSGYKYNPTTGEACATVSTFSVIYPKAGTYYSSNALKVYWTPYSGTFDAYYVMLGNEEIGGSTNVSPDQPISKRATSFTISSEKLRSLMSEMLLNSGGKTASELEDSYYIVVIPAKYAYSGPGGSRELAPLHNVEVESSRFTILADGESMPTNTPPRLMSMSNDSPEGRVAGNSIQFIFTAEDENKDDLGWSIDWGDGSGSSGVCMVNPPAGSSKNWTHKEPHTWYKAGTYKIKATVYDCKGGSDSETYSLQIASEGTSSPITVLSPNGGETWKKGATQRIKWSYSNKPSDARMIILLERYDDPLNYGSPVTVKTFDTKNSGSFSFFISSTDSLNCPNFNCPATGSMFKVRVMDPSIQYLEDVSDNYFSIGSGTAGSSLKVVSPNGGEVWQKGTVQKISWASNVPGVCSSRSGCAVPVFNVSLQGTTACGTGNVCVQGFTVYKIAENVTSPLTWSVGKALDSARLVPDGYYKLEVCSGSSCDTSDSYFRIASESSKSLDITTNEVLPGAYVGEKYSTEIQGTGGTGSYRWSVSYGSLPPGLRLSQGTIYCVAAPCYNKSPAVISGTPTKSGEYKFKVKLIDSAGTRIEETFYLAVKEGATSSPDKIIIRPTYQKGKVYYPGQGHVPLANFNITAPQSEDVTFEGLNFWGFMANSAGEYYQSGLSYPGNHFRNFYLLINGAVNGGQAEVSDAGVISFPKSEFTVPRGTTVSMELRADIMTTASEAKYVFTISGYGHNTGAVVDYLDDSGMVFSGRDSEVEIVMLAVPSSAVQGAEDFTFTAKLSRGAQGEEVMELQKVLTDEGYYSGPIDGKFGGQTVSALVKFQLANGLNGDGVVGAQVRALLNK